MKAKGFTLVEILIVVVILGILAAIVIPQFSGASTEAKESSLQSNLQAMRSQIELYKLQHNGDILPGEVIDAAGNVTAASAASFVNALTSKTDKNGNVGTTAGVHIFGKYMDKIPDNPFSASSTVTVAGVSENASSVAVGASKLAAGSNASGWYVVIGSTDADYGLIQAADPLANPTDATDLHVNY
ncbi:MAG: prepilin-type N-terminal cleavage/methylation domain-containing protein [Sedimentisphaerales bacterium]|nr:prepilin-type N-terminal cleavage/methylation domain-containing protein [Sedimentisphaerales bacterium]